MQNDVRVRNETMAATKDGIGMLAHVACPATTPDVIAEIVLTLHFDNAALLGLGMEALRLEHLVSSGLKMFYFRIPGRYPCLRKTNCNILVEYWSLLSGI
jgi:hypothetical protein